MVQIKMEYEIIAKRTLYTHIQVRLHLKSMFAVSDRSRRMWLAITNSLCSSCCVNVLIRLRKNRYFRKTTAWRDHQKAVPTIDAVFNGESRWPETHRMIFPTVHCPAVTAIVSSKTIEDMVIRRNKREIRWPTFLSVRFALKRTPSNRWIHT